MKNEAKVKKEVEYQLLTVFRLHRNQGKNDQSDKLHVGQ